MIRRLKENKLTAPTSVIVVGAMPMSAIEMASSTNPNRMGTRLSKRDTSKPEKGRLINELIGMASKRVPSSASLYPKVDLMSGMRDAQVEKQIPERKKNALKKNRCLSFNAIGKR